jgi:hypothetical protein
LLKPHFRNILHITLPKANVLPAVHKEGRSSVGPIKYKSTGPTYNKGVYYLCKFHTQAKMLEQQPLLVVLLMLQTKEKGKPQRHTLTNSIVSVATPPI